ncbi:TonB-dependent hemoglobin/transferrin/lactoferrin family receptor [Yersinia hibernica]|uniref:TonB-dependent receptor n=1 Tax=Yersinia enterocolitica LC20 TaxID=1443113 RepID=A0A7U4GIV0_YEREN|nr:TonB-dependent hemoglobin/transferrin/lactoferrin family receptor [Yersinia hibernica]AHM76382.2 TonB-dependent receptor [Yersinia hibernica]OVZ85558.1 TonB-dependent receptor [Yersinia kristensenii]
MDNIARDRKRIINSMNKIAFGICVALTAQGYSERTQADTRVISANEQDMILDELKVEGTRHSHEGDWVYDEPRSVSEISREQMDNRPARHAADILEQTPGVYSSVSQNDPALSVNIRGIQDYGRINMNIDGMRQNFMKSGHGQRNGVMYIDPEILDNVVIEKGVSSGIGGAGVIGGIATFNTINASDFLEPGKEIGGKVRGLTGDNGTQFIGSASLALGNEYGDILIAASERNLKDYWPGNKGYLGELRMGQVNNKFDSDVKNNKVAFTYYKMHTRLAKIGWNLSANQRLALSYLQTQVYVPNAGMFTILYDKATPRIFRYGWLSKGVSNVMNRNIGLDYSLKPEHIAWIDATAKAYYVDTDDYTDTHNANAVFRKQYWTQTRLTTHGLQLQNTSLLNFADHHQLRIKYGLDWFSDNSRGRTTNDYLDALTPVDKRVNGLTPAGQRAITSTFAQLNYDYNDWLRLEGGLRHDKFRIQGNTWMITSGYRHAYTRENPCDPRIHELGEKEYTLCSSNVDHPMAWEVNRREQRLSPTAGIGIKPGVPWLEFFGHYGKSWRPPALTEMLATGSAHGHGWILPNPLAQGENAKTWEAGLNIQHTGLFINDDRLAAKLAYFDTRVKNYINLELAKRKPKFGDESFTNATYINNLLATHFRGLEYQLSYDAGVFYSTINYTRMIGVNSFCSKKAWLGGVQKRARAGYWYSSKKPYKRTMDYPIDDNNANNKIECRRASNLFGSSAYLPGDRGSLVLGGRIFDQKLDFGTTIRYNKGHQDRSVTDKNGFPNTAYVADWPKYIIYDIYASYKATNNLILRGTIENITNRAYLINYGDSLSMTPNRGRTIQGAIEYSF